MTRSLLAILLASLLVLSPGSVVAHPGDEAHPPAATAPAVPAGAAAGAASAVTLVGALALSPRNGVHADVAAYANLAFVGKWSGPCPASGVDIIDIANPAAPVKLADTDDVPDTSMEDMQAIRIGARDVLAVGLQRCGGGGSQGLELVDITEPRTPERLSLLRTELGVHELNLTRTPDGRTLALLAVPMLELITAGENGRGGRGDLLIVDISDPVNPTIIAEWGLLDEPALGPEVYRRTPQGSDARNYLHSVRANADGTRAYLSYWDAGVILLDIGDPARPVYLGRTTFAPGEEGNAHSVAETAGGTILVQADEDFTPYDTALQSSAFAGGRPIMEGGDPARPGARALGRLSGEVAHVGRGCPAGTVAADSPADPYLADPRGKVALIERGGCPFDTKIARAQLAGASAVIVYNTADGGEALVGMSLRPSVPLPDGTSTALTIPTVFAGRGTGAALRDAPTPPTVELARRFNGWGYLRFFDIADPAQPVQIGQFATANTANEAVAGQGMWSVHNPEVRGTLLYASWYRDGVRVLDIADPRRPREIGFWAGAGAPADAPPVDIWGVMPHGDLLLASDRHFGLYILRAEAPATEAGHTPRGPWNRLTGAFQSVQG